MKVRGGAVVSGTVSGGLPSGGLPSGELPSGGLMSGTLTSGGSADACARARGDGAWADYTAYICALTAIDAGDGAAALTELDRVHSTQDSSPTCRFAAPKRSCSPASPGRPGTRKASR